MKKHRKFSSLLIVTAAALVSGLQAGTLFQDTFNRTSSDDLDAETAGMSGSIPVSAGNVYTQTGLSSVIGGGQWGKTSGTTMGTATILHDFQESDLLTRSDGKYHMRISLTATDLTASGDAGDRFVGFGLGYSQAAASAFADANTANGGIRGAVSSVTTTGAAGFFVNYNPVFGSFQIFEDGVLVDSSVPNTELGTLSADFYFDAVAAGSAMSYIIYHNGAEIYSGTYTLANNENYVAFGARGATYAVDSITVETTGGVSNPSALGLWIISCAGLLPAQHGL
ncbi:MAG: hypothetical protein WC701_11480 [Kiritimatiellales bacterium]